MQDNRDRCFTACRNSLLECNSGDHTVTILLPKCQPAWRECVKTCAPRFVDALSIGVAFDAFDTVPVTTRDLGPPSGVKPCHPDCYYTCMDNTYSCYDDPNQAWHFCTQLRDQCEISCDKGCSDAFAACKARPNTDCRSCCQDQHEICNSTLTLFARRPTEVQACLDRRNQCYDSCPSSAQSEAVTQLSAVSSSTLASFARRTQSSDGVAMINTKPGDKPSQAIQQYFDCWESCGARGFSCISGLAESAAQNGNVDIAVAELCAETVLVCTFTCVATYLDTTGQNHTLADAAEFRQLISRDVSQPPPGERAECYRGCFDDQKDCGSTDQCSSRLNNCMNLCEAVGIEPWKALALVEGTGECAPTAGNLQRRCWTRDQLRCKQSCWRINRTCNLTISDGNCWKRYHTCLELCGIVDHRAKVFGEIDPSKNATAPTNLTQPVSLLRRGIGEDRFTGALTPGDRVVSIECIKQCDPVWMDCMKVSLDRELCQSRSLQCLDEKCGIKGFIPVDDSGNPIRDNSPTVAASERITKSRRQLPPPSRKRQRACKEVCDRGARLCTAGHGNGRFCKGILADCKRACGEPRISYQVCAARCARQVEDCRKNPRMSECETRERWCIETCVITTDLDLPPTLLARAPESTCLQGCEGAKNTCDTLPYRKDCEQKYRVCRHSCSHYDDTPKALVARVDEETCLDNCQAGKNTCDTVRPVRENCELKHARCRDQCMPSADAAHIGVGKAVMVYPRDIVVSEDFKDCKRHCVVILNKCEERFRNRIPVEMCRENFERCKRECMGHCVLESVVPATTLNRVTKRVPNATPVISSPPRSIPTDRSTCMDVCRAAEELCTVSIDEDHKEDCHKGRALCDATCFHSGSIDIDHEASNIPALQQRAEDAQTPSNGRCRDECRKAYDQCIRTKQFYGCFQTLTECEEPCLNSRSVEARAISSELEGPRGGDGDTDEAENKCLKACDRLWDKCMKNKGTKDHCMIEKTYCQKHCIARKPSDSHQGGDAPPRHVSIEDRASHQSIPERVCQRDCRRAHHYCLKKASETSSPHCDVVRDLCVEDCHERASDMDHIGPHIRSDEQFPPKSVCQRNCKKAHSKCTKETPGPHCVVKREECLSNCDYRSKVNEQTYASGIDLSSIETRGLTPPGPIVLDCKSACDRVFGVCLKTKGEPACNVVKAKCMEHCKDRRPEITWDAREFMAALVRSELENGGNGAAECRNITTDCTMVCSNTRAACQSAGTCADFSPELCWDVCEKEEVCSSQEKRDDSGKGPDLGLSCSKTCNTLYAECNRDKRLPDCGWERNICMDVCISKSDSTGHSPTIKERDERIKDPHPDPKKIRCIRGCRKYFSKCLGMMDKSECIKRRDVCWKGCGAGQARDIAGLANVSFPSDVEHAVEEHSNATAPLTWPDTLLGANMDLAVDDGGEGKDWVSIEFFPERK